MLQKLLFFLILCNKLEYFLRPFGKLVIYRLKYKNVFRVGTLLCFISLLIDVRKLQPYKMLYFFYALSLFTSKLQLKQNHIYFFYKGRKSVFMGFVFDLFLMDTNIVAFVLNSSSLTKVRAFNKKVSLNIQRGTV